MNFWTSAEVPLQLLEQARLPQHLGIQASGRNKEDREFQRVRRVDVFAADLLRTAFVLVFEVAPLLGSQLGVAGCNRFPEVVIVLAGKLGVDGQQDLVAVGGELDRVFDALGTIGPDASIFPAMNEASSKYRPEQMTEGWIAGMIVEAALKGAGADATPAKVRVALQNLKVDMQGLRGGPLEWTSENHFRLMQYYRVYHWDGAKIAPVKDWFAYEVK